MRTGLRFRGIIQMDRHGLDIYSVPCRIDKDFLLKFITAALAS